MVKPVQHIQAREIGMIRNAMQQVKNMARWSRAAAFIAALALPGASAGAQEIKRGGTLVQAITDNPPNLVVGVNTAIPTFAVGGQIFDTLLKIDAKFALQPSLAQSWDISPDGMQYTFHLRPGVTWHDGQPFTSADIQYSFLEMNGKYNSLATAAYKSIDRIDTPDPLTAVVRLKTPDPSFFPWAFAQPNFASIFPKHIYAGSDPRNNPANFKPIGTGPFVFKEWVRGSHIALDRNPKYFDAEHVYLDRVIFQIIPDAGSRQIALERGDVDFIPYFALAPSSVEPLAANPKTEVIDSLRPALGEIIMFMNLRNPILAKKEVRHAMVHAIDREILVKLALNGRGHVAVGPIRSDNQPFFNPDVPKYPHDPALANKLLDQAGYPRKPDGSRFQIRLIYQASGEGGSLQAAGEIMREQLKRVGIDLVLMPSDDATWLNAAFIQWDFDLSLGSYGTGPDPSIAVTRLYTTENIRKTVSSNLMGYSNPVVDDLLNRADKEMNQAERAQLYQKAQSVIVEDSPAIWLWEKFYPIAVRKGLVGLPSGSMHWEVYTNVGWAK
jgi:peptide/nickel transport system substrate-binding protein